MLKNIFKKPLVMLSYPVGILLFLVLLISVAYYSDFIPHNHYVKGNIDDIVYAEPTQEAKDFDVEGYINSLPSVNYQKIDYPIKETYTYEFNGYVLTVDIPAGFEAYEIKLDGKPEVIDSTSIEDSCDRPGARQLCSGPKDNYWREVEIQSYPSLCIISDTQPITKDKCEGIAFRPKKSQFKGVNLRDYYMRIITNKEIYSSKNITKNSIYFSVHKNKYTDMESLVSDSQILSVYLSAHAQTNKDLYYSVLNSIKISKE